MRMPDRGLTDVDDMGNMTLNRQPPRQQPRSLLPDVVIFVLAIGVVLYVILHGAQAMNYHWQWYRVPAFFGRDVDGEFIVGPLLRGLQVTGEIVGLAMGITLTAGLGTAL